MEKLVLKENALDYKYGRLMYPWSDRKIGRINLYNDPNIFYEYIFSKKCKVLNLGDDLFRCTGITTGLNFYAPNVDLVNMNIFSCTDHPKDFGKRYNNYTYDFMYLKEFNFTGKGIIFHMCPHGEEGKIGYGKYNSTSSFLEKASFNVTDCNISLIGQQSFDTLTISSPTKKLEHVILTVSNCKGMKTVDLSTVEEINIRGFEDQWTMDENITYKFNPNLKLGMSTLHRWANWDHRSPFRYVPEQLNDQYHEISKSGKMISLKEIIPDIEQNPNITVKDLRQKINEFLINKAYSKPYAFQMYQDFENHREFKPAISQENNSEYQQWKKDEAEKERLAAIKAEKERQEYLLKCQKEEEIRKAKEAEEKRLAELAFEQKIANFKKWCKTLSPVQCAYLESLQEYGWLPFQGHMSHSNPLDYFDDPTLLSEIDTREKIEKKLLDGVESYRVWWTGPSDDGDSGRAEAEGLEATGKIMAKVDERLAQYSKQKTRG